MYFLLFGQLHPKDYNQVNLSCSARTASENDMRSISIPAYLHSIPARNKTEIIRGDYRIQWKDIKLNNVAAFVSTPYVKLLILHRITSLYFVMS